MSEQKTLVEMAAENYEDSCRWFPNMDHNDLGHTILCLAGEVGELANIYKKEMRGTHQIGYEEAFKFELVDVFTYLLKLAAAADIDLYQAYYEKREYNEERFGPLRSLPQQVLAEAGLVPERRQNWQTGELAS